MAERIQPGQRLLATRERARKIVAAHPKVSGAVEIDCQSVEALTPPFVDELWQAWPDAVFVNGNEDVRATVGIVRRR